MLQANKGQANAAQGEAGAIGHLADVKHFPCAKLLPGPLRHGRGKQRYLWHRLAPCAPRLQLVFCAEQIAHVVEMQMAYHNHIQRGKVFGALQHVKQNLFSTGLHKVAGARAIRPWETGIVSEYGKVHHGSSPFLQKSGISGQPARNAAF